MRIKRIVLLVFCILKVTLLVCKKPIRLFSLFSFSFLHTKGYTFFSMNALTIGEINLLVELHNEENKRQERELRRAKLKRK